MISQTASGPEGTSFWTDLLRNINLDPLAIFMYVIFAGLLYFMWRHRD